MRPIGQLFLFEECFLKNFLAHFCRKKDYMCYLRYKKERTKTFVLMHSPNSTLLSLNPKITRRRAGIQP